MILCWVVGFCFHDFVGSFQVALSFSLKERHTYLIYHQTQTLIKFNRSHYNDNVHIFYCPNSYEGFLVNRTPSGSPTGLMVTHKHLTHTRPTKTHTEECIFNKPGAIFEKKKCGGKMMLFLHHTSFNKSAAVTIGWKKRTSINNKRESFQKMFLK